MEKLRAQFGFSLERPRDPETAALNRMVERMNDYIRREARRYINTVKTRRFQDAGKVSAAEKKKLWPFAEDETAIAPDASWEQVEAALDIIGNGDQFTRIRDEALRLYGVPEDVVSTHPLDDPEEVMKEFRAARETVRKMHEKKYADIKVRGLIYLISGSLAPSGSSGPLFLRRYN